MHPNIPGINIHSATVSVPAADLLKPGNVLPQGPAPATYIITNFNLDVNRNYIGETYSFSNTYTLNFEGVIFHPLKVDPELLSTEIKDRVTTLFGKSAYDSRVKSLSFPADTSKPNDLNKTAKFSISFEIRQKTVDNANFLLASKSNPPPSNVEANHLLPAVTIEPYGDDLKEISESFSFDDSEGGSGLFSHTFNFSLMPQSSATAYTVTGGTAPPVPIRTEKGVFLNYFRTKAAALVTALTAYETFFNLITLFTTTTTAKTSNYSNFNASFFTDNHNFIHSETFDLFAFTYSLNRTRKYYKNYNATASYDMSYTLTVDQEGIIEITEEGKVEGSSKSFTAVRALLDSTVDKIEANVTGAYGGGALGNGAQETYLLVRASYRRCQLFLQNYKKLLRYESGAGTGGAASGASGYNTLINIDSLRPIAIERTITAIPMSSSLVYSIKYTNNPNIRFGYECDESLKSSEQNGIFSISHSFDVKTFKFKNTDSVGFDTTLGSDTNYGITFSTFRAAKIKESVTKVHLMLNAANTTASPYLPVPRITALLRGLRKVSTIAAPVALAMIKQTSNVANRGRTFSLSFSYSNENKYAPLYIAQKENTADFGTNLGPTVAVLMTSLGLPSGKVPITLFLKTHFTTFDVKVSKKNPVEKFTQRIVAAKPNAIIDPSYSVTPGSLTITYTGRLKRSQFMRDPDLEIFLSNATYLAKEFHKKILQAEAMTHLKTLTQSIITRELSPVDGYTIMGATTSSVLGGQHFPSSVSYKYDSDFNFEMTTEIQFYGKKVSTPITTSPIFVHRANVI